MQDEEKTKAQLIEDVTRLRQRLMALERREAERTRELADTRAELTEALARQEATGEILRVISNSPTDVQPTFDTIATSASTLCEAQNGGVFRFDGRLIHLVAHHNWSPDELEALDRVFPIPPGRGSVTARAILTRTVAHVLDIAADSEYISGSIVQAGFRTTLSVPMLRDGNPIGAITTARREVKPFSDSQIALLKTFADQAVIAIENARLFQELEARNRELTEALEQQTATSEILRVISSSPTDVQPAFDAIARSAVRLCDARIGAVFQFDGDLLHLAAHYNFTPDVLELVQRLYPTQPSREQLSGRVILAKAVVQVADLLADPEYRHQVALAGGWRSMLVVPMLREGNPVGVISINRAETGTFPERQIELLQTFADQAAIAIENVRLFQELQARTQDLTRSVEELQALGEVSQAVNSSLDLHTVLSRIVAHAVQLTGTDGGTIYEYDEPTQAFHLRAAYRMADEIIEALQTSPIRLGEGALGQAAAAREPVQIPDISGRGSYPGRLRTLLEQYGFRAVLAIPILREEHIIGGLVVLRKSPGEFPPKLLELLRTFAAQSALAIQNARLFRELDDKGQQLESASRYKSEFLANMSHELRTPLNAIIGYSEMLQEEAEDLGHTDFTPDLQKINAAGKHLLALINDILDLSKIEAGRMDLYLETFDLAAMLRDVETTVQPLVEKNANTLVVQYADHLGIMRADLTKVRQALFNLLSNACKFTRHGTVTLAVMRQAEAGVEWITCRVSDTGIGMTPEQMGRLFQAFSQAEVSTARQFGGTGLSLAITRKFCQMMGGDVAVASEGLGKGSTFTVRLPAEVADPKATAGG